jgi:RNA polymerase sigma factor (sigma-70 family)
MPPPAIATATDVAALTDEELLRLVGEERCAPARSALVERHYPEVCDLVARCGKKHGLAYADQEDARQEVLCALFKALDKFAARGKRARGEREFRNFLVAFGRGRYVDCVRALRRHESHIDRSVPIEELLERASAAVIEDSWDDPAESAAKEELRARLDAARPQLDMSMRQLWDELESGHSFRASAAALGLSYYQVRRLCKRMIDLLRDRLTDGTDEPRGVPRGGQRACE